MGGAADFKVGVQNRIREQSERKKFFVPLTFPNVGVQASKYQYRLNILKFAVWRLAVALINIGRPRPMPMVL